MSKIFNLNTAKKCINKYIQENEKNILAKFYKTSGKDITNKMYKDCLSVLNEEIKKYKQFKTTTNNLTILYSDFILEHYKLFILEQIKEYVKKEQIKIYKNFKIEMNNLVNSLKLYQCYLECNSKEDFIHELLKNLFLELQVKEDYNLSYIYLEADENNQEKLEDRLNKLLSKAANT